MNGQLGNGLTADLLSPPSLDVLTGVAQVAEGYTHTCALMTSGGVRCWGGGMLGQLGNGLLGEVLSPPTQDVLTGVAQISAGMFHTCALIISGGASALLGP